MNTIQLIEQYIDCHGGKSSYIDSRLRLAQQAAQDARRCLEQNDPDYVVANLAIARSIINDLAGILTLYPSPIWDELIIIYHTVDNELTELIERTEKL
ncbi:MAG: hypothetical protein JJE30_03020 [Desulfuromonadales bacterium]|nr:hypothetical protein [Desulfuromonadales bacterium]